MFKDEKTQRMGASEPKSVHLKHVPKAVASKAVRMLKMVKYKLWVVFEDVGMPKMGRWKKDDILVGM